MDLAQGFNCTFCPSLALDPLGHHATTCKHGGDVVSHRNKLCDVFVECCRRANVSAQVEVGSGFGHDKRNTRPADVTAEVPNWSLGKPAAFDLTVTSPLNPSIFSEAGVTAGSAALVAACHKHDLNDPKCSELGWKCTPLAVEAYGCWGAEARETLAVEAYGCWGAEARETLAVETYGCWGAEARETLALETYGCWGAEARETLAVETYGCWGAEARETLAVETYGCWGAEARETLSHLATRLAIPMKCTKSNATADIYGRLSLTLLRSCARALLSRAGPSLVITG